jgi:hypothetical protein
MSRRLPCTPAPIDGQAMTEALVAMTSLVFLFIGVVMLGRWHDVQHRAIEAARFLAFDALRATDPDRSQKVRDELRAQFEHPGWTDIGGEMPLIRSAQDVALEEAEGEPPGRMPAIVRFVLEPLVSVGGFLGGSFDLTQRGFHRAEVRVALADLPALPDPLDRLGLELREHLSILGDPWHSSGPEQVASRVAGLMPTSLLGEQQLLIEPLLALLSVVEPRIDELCFGYIAPDIVPEDRLGPLPRGRRATPFAGC